MKFRWKLENIYNKTFVILLAVSLFLRVVWLDMPIDVDDPMGRSSLIGDERYWVNVARTLLRLPTYPPNIHWPQGMDPYPEHPPLAKLIIAFSIGIIGDNAWGWRIPSVVLGMASIIIFYLLVKRLSRSPKMALLASFLLSFDNLFFVYSRIATLDIFMLTFMLLGFYLYHRKKMALSAIALAFSTLSKMGGFYGFATIATYHFLNDIRKIEKPRKKETEKCDKLRTPIRKIFIKDKLRWLGSFTLVYALSFLTILFIFDLKFTAFSSPFDHIIFIYRYTVGITSPVLLPQSSFPWQWLLNEVIIPYLVVGTGIAFVGAMNPSIIYLCLPAIAYTVYEYYKRGDDLSVFILAWFCCTYLPFYLWSIVIHRILYLFYFLNTVPSVCVAISFTLLNRKMPKWLVALYLTAVLVGFATLFPFKQIS